MQDPQSLGTLTCSAGAGGCLQAAIWLNKLRADFQRAAGMSDWTPRIPTASPSAPTRFSLPLHGPETELLRALSDRRSLLGPVTAPWLLAWSPLKTALLWLHVTRLRHAAFQECLNTSAHFCPVFSIKLWRSFSTTPGLRELKSFIDWFVVQCKSIIMAGDISCSSYRLRMKQ